MDITGTTPVRNTGNETSDGPTTSIIERAFHDALTPAESEDDTRVRLLDAAYDQFCAGGIHRSSMADIAKRARMSRITLYRKFDSKDDLVEAVIAREFRRYFARFLVEIGHARTVADRIVFGFVSSLRAIRTNPLIGSLLASERTTLAGAIGGDDGTMLATVRRFVAGQLRREQNAGMIPADLDTELVAEMLVRVSASFLTTPSHVVDIDDDDALTALARRFLVPMVLPNDTHESVIG